MKKKSLFAGFLSLVVFCQIHGVESVNKASINYGYQKYGKETMDSIQGNGTVILEGTKVLGLVQVNGSLNAEESAMDSLRINGQVELRNCLITNTSSVNGSLTADNTKFQKELSVASQKIILRMCSLKSLTIREVTGFTGAQVVDLRSGTRVSGPIVVESGNGEIWISSNSEISLDQVSGAQVYKK